MTTMWTNFAKYGDPTPPGDDLQLRWDAVTAEDMRWAFTHIIGLCLHISQTLPPSRYLTIDTNLTMGLDEDYITRMAFWDSIF